MRIANLVAIMISIWENLFSPQASCLQTGYKLSRNKGIMVLTYFYQTQWFNCFRLTRSSWRDTTKVPHICKSQCSILNGRSKLTHFQCSENIFKDRKQGNKNAAVWEWERDMWDEVLWLRHVDFSWTHSSFGNPNKT